MNIFKAETENKTGKALFYIFEICAIAIAVISLFLSIYYAVNYESFVAFIEYFTNGVISAFTIFGFGKIIDMLYARKSKCEKKSVETENKETTDVE